MVMQRLGNYQSGGMGNLTGPNASVNLTATVGGSVDTGSASVTGIVVLIALAIAFLGWHGLKG
jgi:hypothetical protein